MNWKDYVPLMRHLSREDWKLLAWGIVIYLGCLLCWFVASGRLEFFMGWR